MSLSKVQIIRILNGCSVQNEISITRVTVWDADQLSRVMEFSICSEQPLWILFLGYFSIAFRLEYVLSNLH